MRLYLFSWKRAKQRDQLLLSIGHKRLAVFIGCLRLLLKYCRHETQDGICMRRCFAILEHVCQRFEDFDLEEFSQLNWMGYYMGAYILDEVDSNW